MNEKTNYVEKGTADDSKKDNAIICGGFATAMVGAAMLSLGYQDYLVALRREHNLKNCGTYDPEKDKFVCGYTEKQMAAVKQEQYTDLAMMASGVGMVMGGGYAAMCKLPKETEKDGK